MRYQSRKRSSSTGESIAKRSFCPLPCSIRSSIRLESTSDTLSATTGDPQSGAVGRAQCGLVLRSGCRLQQACNLVETQDQRHLARLAHQRKVPRHVCPTERHSEEETQRRNRTVVDAAGSGEGPRPLPYPASGRERL